MVPVGVPVTVAAFVDGTALSVIARRVSGFIIDDRFTSVSVWRTNDAAGKKQWDECKQNVSHLLSFFI
jgi:hypothetical protein